MIPRSNDSTVQYYEERWDEYIVRTDHLSMENLYEPFLALVPRGGAILDAGCGQGRDVKSFIDRGYVVTAIDASAKMVALTKQRTGVDALQTRFQDLTYDDRFDGIWACASLLHVPLVDMQDVLGRLRKALKKDGVCYMSFKHGSGERVEDGRRFVDFTLPELYGEIHKTAGLSVNRIWLTPDQSGRCQIRWVNAIVCRID